MEKFILDIRDIPKELILIIDILKSEDNKGIQKYLKDESDHIDWKIFMELINHHRLYPLFSFKLKSYDPSLFPQFIIENVRNNYRKNIFKMLQLSGEMEQLANLFCNNGIKTIFLKGPMLGKEIYGDVSLRTCGDLDLLIPIEKLNIVHDLLIDNGYVKDEYIQSILDDWKWRHHHFTYYHKEKNIKIEIHWRLNPGPGKEPRFNELWERKTISVLSTSPIYILGREDLFLFLVSHGARHGWSRLRWLIDIQIMIKKGLDWNKIQILSKKHDNFHVVGQSILLSSQLLNTEPTNEMEKFIDYKSNSLAQEAVFYFKKMISLHSLPLPKDISLYHARHLYSLMSRQQKIMFILSNLYPYPIDKATLSLPKSLHFLYFLLRPFLCLWRKLRKQELSLGESK